MESLWKGFLSENNKDYESAAERNRRLGRLHESLGWKKKGVFSPAWAVAASVVLILGCFCLALDGLLKKPAATERICLLSPASSKALFVLPDGSRVWLNGGSRLSYEGDENSWRGRNVTLDGEAFFDVVRDENHPFTVRTGALGVTVLGTRFNVRNSAVSGNYQVVLSSGRVDVALDGQDRIKLSPGEMFECSKASGEFSVRQVEASNYTGWTADAIRFDNRTLEDVAVNLEHRYNVRVTLSPGVPVHERISFTLSGESLEEAMKVVSRLARVRCRIDSDEIVIEK